jgi:hypothetical protein
MLQKILKHAYNFGKTPFPIKFHDKPFNSYRHIWTTDAQTDISMLQAHNSNFNFPAEHAREHDFGGWLRKVSFLFTSDANLPHPGSGV